MRKTLGTKRKKDGTIYEQNKPVYPDMTLYEEILLLDGYYDGLYVVENVIPWYEPLIVPQKLGRHCFWSNIELPQQKFEKRGSFNNTEELAIKLGYDISNWSGVNKKLLLRNCVEPEVGLYIFNLLKGELQNDN